MSTTSSGKKDFSESMRESKSLLDKLSYDQLDPVQLRRVFLLLSRACFNSKDAYDLTSELKDPEIVYNDKASKRTIDVELDFLYDPEKVNEEPCVYVGLGDISFERKGVGDVSGISEDNSTYYYACESSVPLFLRHVSASPDMSYLLANHSLLFYLAMKRLLLSNIPGLGDIKLQTMSKVNINQVEQKRSFRTDVTFILSVIFSWASTSEDHRIKDIPFSIEQSS